MDYEFKSKIEILFQFKTYVGKLIDFAKGHSYLAPIGANYPAGRQAGM
jgi:hypothetical protein